MDHFAGLDVSVKETSGHPPSAGGNENARRGVKPDRRLGRHEALYGLPSLRCSSSGSLAKFASHAAGLVARQPSPAWAMLTRR